MRAGAHTTVVPVLSAFCVPVTKEKLQERLTVLCIEVGRQAAGVWGSWSVTLHLESGSKSRDCWRSTQSGVWHHSHSGCVFPTTPPRDFKKGSEVGFLVVLGPARLIALTHAVLRASLSPSCALLLGVYVDYGSASLSQPVVPTRNCLLKEEPWYIIHVSPEL